MLLAYWFALLLVGLLVARWVLAWLIAANWLTLSGMALASTEDNAPVEAYAMPDKVRQFNAMCQASTPRATSKPTSNKANQ